MPTDLPEEDQWDYQKNRNRAFSVMARSARTHPDANSICDAYVAECIDSGIIATPTTLFAKLDSYFHHSNQEKREKADREFKNLRIIRFEKVTKKAENLMKKKYSEVDKVFQLREGLKIRGLEGLMTQLTADNIKTVEDMKVIIFRLSLIHI